MKNLIINDGHDIEVIPSALTIKALRRKEQAVPCLVWPAPEPITVGRIPEPITAGVRGRGGKIVGTVLIGGVVLVILVQLIIFWIK